MVIHDSRNYRIEHHPNISVDCPYALDHKERKGERVCLNNIGWYATESQAYQARNEHAGWTKIMNFQQIERFTRTPHYRINVGWKHVQPTLDSWSKREGELDLDPEFQRGHVWTEAQQIAFVEFVLKGGVGSLEIKFNHPGWNKDYKGTMQLVDGKQRLTAVLRFMNNEIQAFGTYLKDFTGYLPSHAELLFLVNDLQTEAEVLQWYLEINAGGTPHTEEELNKVHQMLKKVKPC